MLVILVLNSYDILGFYLFFSISIALMSFLAKVWKETGFPGKKGNVIWKSPTKNDI